MMISVITVCFNSEATITHTIESFLKQDYPNKEMIVIDGGSSDRTLEIIDSFDSPLIKVASGPDRGIYHAMNKGLRLYQGDGFGFLNSDDQFHDSSALSSLAAGLSKACLVSGTLHFVRRHDGSAPTRVWRPVQHQKGAFHKGYSLPHPTTYARREVHDRVGEFDETLRNAGDYDWLLRALELEGLSHLVLSDVLVDMQLGGESTAGLSALIRNAQEVASIRRHRLAVGAMNTAAFRNVCAKLLQIVEARVQNAKRRS